MPSSKTTPSIAVIIPCYRVKDTILDVLGAIPSFVSRIYCIDDGCPDYSGKHIQNLCQDARVLVLFHEVNEGVGGAVITGYRQAIKDKMTILVKMDGDGQMDSQYLYSVTQPIINGEADYTKGNRFFDLSYLKQMPPIRIFGNAVLSFLTKFSTGYWFMMDPTNGYTAIHANVLQLLNLSTISKRYFFESDMLFHFSLVRAVVQDIPMPSIYKNEISHLKVSGILVPFLIGNLKNFFKRLLYQYVLRDLSIGSFALFFSLPLLFFGGSVGINAWIKSIVTHIPASAGTVMLAALPFLVGIQCFLLFLHYDILQQPRNPIYPYIYPPLSP